MKVKKYRKKPIEIEAIELVNTKKFSEKEVFLDFISNDVKFYNTKDGIVIETLEGNMLAQWGDYVIKGVNGEFYPCKPDIFHKTYERV